MSRAGTDEVVVVGGGLAGASAACLLAEAGRPVLVIERDAQTRHKVCGEFLSVEAQAYLNRLGIDLDTLGASRISRLRLVRESGFVEIGLPFLARGLSRKTLDEALLQRAASLGARIMRGQAVRSIAAEGSRIHMEIGSGDGISSDTVFLATGKHDVRGLKRAAAGTIDDLIGFKLHIRLTERQQQALAGAVEVILFSGGYAGLQMIEHARANLCLVVSRAWFDRIGKSWPSLLATIMSDGPHLAERLRDSQALHARPLSIFQIPYGFLHAPDPQDHQGLFRLGDQVGVIPSFTGDGMSIALHSGSLAAATYLAHGNASSIFHHRIRSDLRLSVRLATFLNRMVRKPAGQQVLYRVCRTWPAAMQHVTTLTRIRENAMSGAPVTP